ncbi:MAG: MCP four helix bundle domain-containing protein, partial [Castellaniella sp.]
MRNLKIGTRLAFGFGLIIILLLIMSGIGAWRMIDNQRANDSLKARQLESTRILQWARQVEVNANQVLAAANLTNPDVLAIFKKGMDTSDKQANELQAMIESSMVSPEAKALYAEVMKVRETYVQGRTQAFKDLDNGDYAKADTFFNQEMPKLTARYIAEIDKLSAYRNASVERRFQEGEQATRLGLIVLAVATLLALILGPLFAWLVTRSITAPLRHAVDLAGAVARRDLSRDIQPQGKDEVTSLE